MKRRLEVVMQARGGNAEIGTARSATGRSRRRLARVLVCLAAAVSVLALAPGRASASVIVTDDANFVVSIDANDTVSVGCTAGGKVVVTDDGFSTTYSTNCADVTSLSVTAAGTFSNDINLASVDATSFSSLGSVTLDGGDGDDVLHGSGIDDSISGGLGVDTADYSLAGAAVKVNLARGIATGGDGSDTLSGTENVFGSAFADTLTGDDLGNVLDGHDGNDRLSGKAGNDELNGDNGTDFATGGPGVDTCSAEKLVSCEP